MHAFAAFLADKPLDAGESRERIQAPQYGQRAVEMVSDFQRLQMPPSK
jgi:hypothetical protein